MRPDDTEGNAGRCRCPGCPTYDDCTRGRGERIFCSRGKTDCGLAPKGCICGTCPVWSEYGLEDYYYCLEGAAG